MSVDAAGPARPPLLRRFLFRLRLARLGREWESWVERDLAAPSFVWWSAVSTLFLLAIGAAAYTAVTREFPVLGVSGFLGVWWGMLLFPSGRRFIRKRDLSWHQRKWDRDRDE